MRCNNEDWAVFWCSLLSPVLLGEIPERRREWYFQQLSQEERLLPNGRRKRLSARTLRRQWRRLKDEGVQGLYRRRRSDRGKSRKKHRDLLARAVALKKEQPFRSDDPSPPAVWQQAFLSAQLVKIPLAPPLGNFSQQHGTQQRAPEDSPIFIATTHKV